MLVDTISGKVTTGEEEALDIEIDILFVWPINPCSLGLHPTDLGRIVEAFYASYNRTRNDDNLNSSTGAPGRRKPPRVDRAFLEHVWKWLVRDPDIFVGRNREGNSLSFSEVEKRNSTHDERQHQKFAKVNEQAEIAYRSSGPSSLVPDDSISAPGEMRNQLRLFATEERMWLAVCGHPRDLTKVFDTEFALLSIIASKRSNGILQGDLVRLSRQDKRSVPKRTDSLRDKGYIEKRPVLAKGARTSILTLKKFAVQEKVFLSRGGNGANSDAIAFIDQDLLIRRAFDALRRMKLMTRDDLKETLGLTTRSQWKLLSRIIRKFEAWGFLKRVHAASAMSSKVQQHYSCVKYLKDVTDEDIKRYTSIGHLPANSMDLDAEGEDDDDFLPGSTEEPAPNAGPLQELGRIYPIWSPDRILSNLVFQVVDSMGTKGITLTELKNHLAGPRYSRPLEVFVGRIVENWASSQPHHLRHLSIIRDTAVDKKIAYFRHYSFRNFTELVERGGAYWEGVVFTGKKDKKYHETISSFLSSPATDSFGFPVSMRPTGQYKEGNASMGELMKGFDPGIWVQSTRDPVAYEVDGQDKISHEGPKILRVKNQKKELGAKTQQQEKKRQENPA
ncbi:putative tfiiic transcription initiation factor complex subunit [Phaeomoniella chlamydospora]|uniref:Putative tfiiic transcription initiation factor complex subunit n=1 Tax=Phaeomoniella chlamydospora TaxID=158046 RepID=A0A0G2HEU5_PHACM|nr:putative tfiiic transcription initiation factor complex subunit [Phaeomoniella chlamydospora]